MSMESERVSEIISNQIHYFISEYYITNILKLTTHLEGRSCIYNVSNVMDALISPRQQT